MLSIQGPKQILKRIVFGPGIYLVPRDDGLIIVGATSEPEAGFQTGLTPNGQSELQKGIQSLIPELNQLPHMRDGGVFVHAHPTKAPYWECHQLMDSGLLLGIIAMEFYWQR